jgi:hypothetical protein
LAKTVTGSVNAAISASVRNVMVLLLKADQYAGTYTMKSLLLYPVCAATNRGNDFCTRMCFASGRRGHVGPLAT